MPSVLIPGRARFALGLLALLISPAARAATQTERKPQDSAAALAFTKQPLRAWWDALPETEHEKDVHVRDDRLHRVLAVLRRGVRLRVLSTGGPG